MISNLFFYKIMFMAEILTAEYLLTLGLRKRSLFYVRFFVGAAVLLGLSAIPVPLDNIWFSSLVLMLEFGFTLPFLFVCYDESWRNILFCAVAAYTLQHCAYGAVNFALSLIFQARSPLLSMYENAENSIQSVFSEFTWETALCIVVYLICYFGVYALVSILFDKRIKRCGSIKIKNYMLLLLCALGMLLNIILNSAMMAQEAPFINILGEYTYSVCCCAFLLYLQYSMLYNKELKNELEVVQSLLASKEKQYEMSKENIDIINRKCHDMKHQIRTIGKNTSLPHDVIAEMEKSVSLYESVVKTGNDALDIILTEKSLLCGENGIQLSCMADGTLLDFMSQSDLYSLFGNALDNAVESVMKIDGDKRLIALKIHRAGELVAVNIQNPAPEGIRFGSDDLPVTDKADKENHGFGVKSIAYIVHRYRGNLSMDVKDGQFRLNIIFPSETV